MSPSDKLSIFPLIIDRLLHKSSEDFHIVVVKDFHVTRERFKFESFKRPSI